MGETPQTPRPQRQGITVTQTTAIRQAPSKPAVINPYVSQRPVEGPPRENDKASAVKKGAGSITVTQETNIRNNVGTEKNVINSFVAHTPVKPKQLGLQKAANSTLLQDAKQNLKDGLHAQDSIASKTIAGYITVGETGIKTWKAAQAATPAVITGAKGTIKVVRGTLKATKGIIVFLVSPVVITQQLIQSATAKVVSIATRVKAKVDSAAAATKKAYTVVRGVLTGTVALPPGIGRKIAGGIFKGVKYAGKVAVKATVVTAFKAGVKTVKIGGLSLVAAGNMIGKADDIGAQAFGTAVTGGKYTVKAVKYTPKVAKGVYQVGKTTVMVPVKTVQGGVAVVKGTVKVVKSVQSNGWVKTAGKVGQKVKTAAVKATKALVNAVKLVFKAAANKILLPLLIIVLGFILIFQVISIPVQAGGALFSSVFSIFSPSSGQDTETDVHQYVTDAATAAREKYEQDIMDTANSNLKANGGAYDFVRLYIGSTCDDQVADALTCDAATIDDNIFTIDELTNLAQPIFNAIVLTKYDLKPTETEAKDTIDDILSTLLKYNTQPMKTEWCEYEDGDPTIPHYCPYCGRVHAHIDCPNSVSGYHDTWTCPLCDSYYDDVEVGDDGVAVHTTEFNCSGYTYCQGHSILGIFIIQDGWYELTDKYFQQPIDELSNKATRTADEENELQSLKDGYDLAMAYINQTQLSFGDLSVSDLSGVDFLPGDRPGNDAIPDYAKQFVGNIGGQPFWSWYGYSSRVEWCGCFVSYVLAHCGMADPKYSSCEAGADWFKSNGEWYAGSGYAAVAGDIIFFDWNGKGETHHTGIVVGHDDQYVYTIEGNSVDDMCRIRQYPINSSVIFGYGLPNY